MFKKIFSSHYKMEAFIGKFTVLLGLMIVVIILSFQGAAAVKANTLTTKALYNTELRFSKTNVGGKMVGVYTSENKKRSFILFKLDDLTKVSLKPDQYKVFVTEAALAGNLPGKTPRAVCSYYVFGSTGYMGISFTSQTAFPSRVLDITLRSLKELAISNISADDKVTENSFTKYDQAKIYVNPGAERAIISKSLSEEVFDPARFYYEVLIEPEELEVKNRLNYSVTTLDIELQKMEEFETRLRDVHKVQVPKRPVGIIGDNVIDGEYGRKFIPASVVAKGFDFVWQNHSVWDGFLSDLIAKSQNPEDTKEAYLIKRLNEQKVPDLNHRDEIEWRLSDGTLLTDLSVTSSAGGRVAEITNDINNLLSTYENYKTEKDKYQSSYLLDLLTLEMKLDGVRNTFSSEVNEVVKYY